MSKNKQVCHKIPPIAIIIIIIKGTIQLLNDQRKEGRKEKRPLRFFSSFV